MKLITPPTFHDLYDDPVFKRYVHARPRIAVATHEPWVVLARRSGTIEAPRWAMRPFVDYREALDKALSLDPGKFDDVAIICKPKLWRPPMDFTWSHPFIWCGRCRRPSRFIMMARPERHPMLRNAPAITRDEPYRCYYCGMRRAAQPVYKERFSEKK